MNAMRLRAKMAIIVGLLWMAGWACGAAAQDTKPRMKLGAYYFAG